MEALPQLIDVDVDVDVDFDAGADSGQRDHESRDQGVCLLTQV